MPPVFRIERSGKVFAPAFETRSYPYIMGILNVNGDSFSDGGAYLRTEDALAHALQMLSEGADIVDLGAESTRPGAAAVPDSLQLERLLPVVKALRAAAPEAVISIDTRSAAVAGELLRAGADMINDVSGLRRDPGIARVAAEYGAGLCVMHMRGEPETMQNPENLLYENLIGEVSDFLVTARKCALDAGVSPDSVLLDPGIGFSKTTEQNLELIRAAGVFRALGSPMLYGVSRKTFIGKICGKDCPADRDFGTAGVLAYLTAEKTDFVRVHRVDAALSAMKMFAFCAKKQKDGSGFSF